MSRAWRQRLPLVAGVLLVLAAVWVVLGRGGGEGSPPGASSSATSSSSRVPTSGSTPDSGLPVVAEADLPAEGRETLALIHDGGPFPYDRDGATFGNREGILPDQARGYYAEYTVPTPGEDDRGARRLVVGDDGDVYYTDDHYESFRQVEEEP